MGLGKELLNKFLLISILFIVAGCGGTGANTGTLSLSLTDASDQQYKAVYVTVKEVRVHKNSNAEDGDGGWVTVASPEATYNLLDLVNGVREELGIATLESGTYSQMRLLLTGEPDDGINILSHSHPFGNYVIDSENEVHELKVPSGFQTGIKIVKGFEINANETTELLLDFDANKSVVIAGKSGMYLLKPVIKLLDTTDFAIIQGVVRELVEEGDPEVLLGGALVSAQLFDPSAPDLKDEVVLQTSTISDGDGNYKLFLAPGTYNLVAVLEGFGLYAKQITVGAAEVADQDISLESSDTGTLSGEVNIAGADNDTFVTLSIRMEADTGGQMEPVEVLSLNVANGGNYQVTLPIGDYQVVSSTFGETTQEAMVMIMTDTDTLLDIDF